MNCQSFEALSSLKQIALRVFQVDSICQTPIRRSGSWNGRGYSNALLMMLKIAVSAPS
jgi:hypothetical protein